MKNIVLIITGFILTPLLSFGQTTDKIANEAYVLIRMVNKFHVEPREVNEKFSVDLFNNMLTNTDDDKIFFTKGDIDKLSKYRTTLDKQIKNRKTDYLDLFIKIYQRRLQQTDSVIAAMSKKPIDFYASEKITIAEDTSFPSSAITAQVKLYKKLKSLTLDELTDDLPANFKSFAPEKQKKYIDSDLVKLQVKATASLRRKINTTLQNPYGLTQYVGNIYCETIASCFDPHTEFFPPEEKENFESEMGKQPFQFGFKIKADKNGGILIDNLQPGSPAFKSGKLNTGDKFLSIQWEGTAPVDVSDITIRDFDDLIRESNHKKTLFTIKKPDGSVIQVTLQKELATGDDEERVKSFILKGSNTIGYIYLPAFYEDWEANNDGLNGCANDVGREIIKLKKENISGLILDMRYNGGGSVSEAAELTGIFIDAGPVAQEKSRGSRVNTIKDMDRGTIYDGPLVILVNGYSASATELMAGALQDYNRAIIIGSPTYGKATMQVVLPMDTTITPENYSQIQTGDYLKITISKLYRVTGATAQFKGVQPDIVVPDILDAYITKEADEPFAIRPTVINANKYYAPYPALPIKQLSASVQPEIDTSKYFNAVKRFITYANQKKNTKDVSLNVKDVLSGFNSDWSYNDSAILGTESTKFKALDNRSEMEQMRNDANLKEQNDEFRHQVSTDATVNIAYDVLSKLKTQ
jgi:carboxyl-terminal processing protease